MVDGAFLSTSISIIHNRLTSLKFIKLLDNKLVHQLKCILNVVGVILTNAEQKQISSSAFEKSWLDGLVNAVYDADDFVDLICTEAAASPKEVSNVLYRYFNVRDRDIRLEEIVRRIESLLEDRHNFDFRVNLSSRLPSTSFVDESTIYGRDQDKEVILKLLLEDDMCDGQVFVIPIFGMARVGKTTLAQLVYNDKHLKQKFDLQAWASISNEVDILKVMKTIIEGVSKSDSSSNNINLLHLQLKDMLTGKKFLLVLDDSCIEDYLTWNFLLQPLQFGTTGSKIIVTTRSEKVASLPETIQGHYHLKQLSDDACWSVFANHAYLSLESSENTAFEKIGRQIVGRCDGSPLAALSLGGLLRGKYDIDYWNSILNSNIWKVSGNEGNHEDNIMTALRISYNDLPWHLKGCFVHCLLFSKDYAFDKDELILLWMAEDLLVPSKSGKTLEEVGYEYFCELASRSFFQRCSGSKYFVMPDLVHDLATLLGGEFYCRSGVLGKETNFSIKNRHLSFHSFSDQVSENLEMLGMVKSLRTFLPRLCTPTSNTKKAQRIILTNLKCLRVLSFGWFSDIETLPDSIGKMLHLRYLDFSMTNIKTLPESWLIQSTNVEVEELSKTEDVA